MNSPPQTRIWLRRSDIPAGVADIAELRLGGISLYSDDQSRLEAFATQAVTALLAEARSHLTLSSSLLRHRVKEAGLPIETRVFSAVLGYALRTGQADAILCLSSADNLFRVIVHSDNLPRLSSSLAMAAEWITRERRLAVTDLRKKLFPRKEWGSWYHCSALLARLAYLGIARQVDEYTFQFNPHLEHALRDRGWDLSTVDLSGMACCGPPSTSH